MQLAGKVALVTGGALRLGRAIALGLASRACHVVIHYNRSAKDAAKTAAEMRAFGVRSVALHADVTRKSDIERMRTRIEREIGPVDILVNNAAIFEKTPWPSIAEKSWDQHLAVNVKGPFLCAQVFGPGMVSRRGGKIINLTDVAADRPYPSYIPYSVSKAALICLTKGLAKVLAPHVEVNAVSLGPVLLPKNSSAEEESAIVKTLPLRRLGSPEDVRNAVLFLLEGSDFSTGAVYVVDGGRSIA